MPYRIRLSHINRDYSVEPIPTESWAAVIEDDEELVIMLNRVAITSSQNPSHEYPVMDVVAGGVRATITVIGGQFYYTDTNVPNRSNIKVIAEGAVKLLQGSPLENVQQDVEVLVANESGLAHVYRPSRLGARLRHLLWGVLLITLISVGIFIVKELKDQPSLVPDQAFVAEPIDGMTLRAYSGVYLEAIQEGAQVFELTDDGRFQLYEMWQSTESGAYKLVMIESLPIRLGTHANRPALMAGDFFLLLPGAEDRILLGGVQFDHHLGELEDIGRVSKNGR
ncbi:MULTISPECIES: hypothetical protein [unclassified Lentimonas]|uniref:hypothetical protein n=1 Tax=unclassified Lentimonas TaxID=2630993 RepID=UPI001328A3A2|nr:MULTISPECIES: hypothetical protein [unclassified Lentimonas]CAA6690579.1 Unannotated [Lentimonas sp. CC10]CAA6695312.1 Unannotated [Lentimonas sp. CC19]CAA7068836.1 Unannotated [Lentimonas sp. CC11]